MSSELWLVRHGETEWSASGRHTSFTDLPLTERGRGAARDVGARLSGIDFSRIFTSPLIRARDTCALAGFAGRAEILDDLHEWNYGADEGRTTAEIRSDVPDWTIWTHDPRDGESADDVAARADRVVAVVRSTPGRAIAFSHGHFSRVLAARWIGQPIVEASHLLLETAAICALGWERGTPALRLWNDTGRLPV
jgi:probable phosphoglycerate mutase